MSCIALAMSYTLIGVPTNRHSDLRATDQTTRPITVGQHHWPTNVGRYFDSILSANNVMPCAVSTWGSTTLPYRDGHTGICICESETSPFRNTWQYHAPERRDMVKEALQSLAADHAWSLTDTNSVLCTLEDRVVQQELMKHNTSMTV